MSRRVLQLLITTPAGMYKPLYAFCVHSYAFYVNINFLHTRCTIKFCVNSFEKDDGKRMHIYEFPLLVPCILC